MIQHDLGGKLQINNNGVSDFNSCMAHLSGQKWLDSCVCVCICIFSIYNYFLDESERYLSEKEGGCHKQPRTLSLAIVPGGHIRSICIAGDHQKTTPTNPDREDTCTDHTQSTRQSHDIIGQSHDTEEQSHDIRRCLA